MAKMIQIRNVPDDLHRVLRVRAAQAGLSLSDYLLTDEEADPNPERLGKLAVFAGVRGYPVRVKCAALAWRTLEAALDGAAEASTE